MIIINGDVEQEISEFKIKYPKEFITLVYVNSQ